jgi:hypothetical protein
MLGIGLKHSLGMSINQIDLEFLVFSSQGPSPEGRMAVVVANIGGQLSAKSSPPCSRVNLD